MTKCSFPYDIKLSLEKSSKLQMNTFGAPCGKCYDCKNRRIAQWTFRLMKEKESSGSCYFVTLTYDNIHVPIVIGSRPMTLKKEDLQGFFKRLRYYEAENQIYFHTKEKVLKRKQPIKYYAVGEYGGLRHRPHMHIILFNVVCKQSIRESWTFGEVDIDQREVTQEAMQYVCKYIAKEESKKIPNDNRIKEFSLMSKGLGKSFLTKQVVAFYRRQLGINYIISNGFKVAMPRYYREKMLSTVQKDAQAVIIKEALSEKKESLIDGRLQRKALEKKYAKRNFD